MFSLCKNVFCYLYYGFLSCINSILHIKGNFYLAVPSLLLQRRNFTSKFSLSDDKFSFTKSTATRSWFLYFSYLLIMQPWRLVGTSFPLVVALLRSFPRGDAFSQTSQRQLLCGIILLKMYSLWALMYW